MVIGGLVPLAPWLAALEAGGAPLFALPRPARLAQVQRFTDGIMARVGAIVPVTAVPLVCVALQTFDTEFVPEHKLLSHIEELRDLLIARGAEVV